MDQYQKIHFIAGLPRSGSTLLSSILKQNPRFSAGMSSPLEQLYAGSMVLMSPRHSSFSIFFTDTQRLQILKSCVYTYFKDVQYEGKEVCFDTNRCWSNKLESLSMVLPGSVIICCVRDVVDILNSFERITRESPLVSTALFNHEPESTVTSRCEILMNGQRGPLGLAYNSLKDGWSGEKRETLHMVEYEDLVKNPERTMRHLYERIQEPYFGHDFKNIEYSVDEFDHSMGIKNMHTVRREVKKTEYHNYLPKDVQKKYQGLEFWR